MDIKKHSLTTVRIGGKPIDVALIQHGDARPFVSVSGFVGGMRPADAFELASALLTACRAAERVGFDPDADLGEVEKRVFARPDLTMEFGYGKTRTHQQKVRDFIDLYGSDKIAQGGALPFGGKLGREPSR